MSKKSISFMLPLILIFFMSNSTVFAESAIPLSDEVNYVLMQLNSKIMNVNGSLNDVDSGRDTTPVSVDGIIMVPIRVLVEALGGEVNWNETVKEAPLVLNSAVFTIKPNQHTFYRDGVSQSLETAPLTINERLMVPFSFITELIDCETQFYEETGELFIQYKPLKINASKEIIHIYRDDTDIPAFITDESGENLYAASPRELAILWVRAFCYREADNIYGLLNDKGFFEGVGGRFEDGSRRIGLSSLWPRDGGDDNEFEAAQVIIEGENVDYILFWRSSDSVDPERLTMRYIKTDKGYQVINVENLYPTLNSKAAFEYRYITGAFPFIQHTVSYQSLADDNPAYADIFFNPISAAVAQMQVEEAETTAAPQDDGSWIVKFTWADGAVSVIVEQPNIQGDNGAWVVTEIATIEAR